MRQIDVWLKTLASFMGADQGNVAASNNPKLEKSLEQFGLSYEQTLKKTP